MRAAGSVMPPPYEPGMYAPGAGLQSVPLVSLGVSCRPLSAYTEAWHPADAIIAVVGMVSAALGSNSWAPARAPASAAFCTSRRWKYRRPASRPRAMIPKSAVADSATITRLCARFSRRSLISISVLRHHRGLRRDHDPVSGGIADHRDPWLEEERDLDRNRATAGRANAGAVPDVASIRIGWHRRAAPAGRQPGAGVVQLEGKAATQFALNRGEHRRIRRERGIERNGGAGAFARGVRNGVVDVDAASQVDRAQQQQEENRREHGELDHRLTAVAADKPLAHQ